MKILIVLVLFVCLSSGCVPVTPEAPGLGEQPLDAFAYNARLGRAINLGNALEAPREGEWGMTLQEEFFLIIAEAGFNSVRVPIRWSAHALAAAPYTVDADFLARVDWVVEQATANGLAVVLNIHHYDEIFARPVSHRERFLAIWQQIAARYRDAPNTVYFELLNEPHNSLTRPIWNELAAEALALIRQTNPWRAVVIGPVNWNGIDALPSLDVPDDAYIIVTFHYYLPFAFTHQGAEWVSGSDPWLGTVWPADELDPLVIEMDFDRAAAWAQAQNVPLFLGEFGAYSKADMDSRVRWTAHVARAAEARGFSWAYWEFGAGFGAYDRARSRWNTPLLQALIPSE